MSDKKKPAQDMARKARVRRARNKSGVNTDYQAAVKRGDENAGSESKSATTHRDKAAHEKKTGKKIPKGKDFGHTKSLKSLKVLIALRAVRPVTQKEKQLADESLSESSETGIT